MGVTDRPLVGETETQGCEDEAVQLKGPPVAPTVTVLLSADGSEFESIVKLAATGLRVSEEGETEYCTMNAVPTASAYARSTWAK